MMFPFLARAPWWPLLVVAAIFIIGGPLNSVDARGVIVSDANGLPVAPQDVFFGARHYRVGQDGVYDIRNLPRGSKFTVIGQGYGRLDVPADTTEVRLVTAIITFNVADADNGDPIRNPEARLGTRVVGKGTESGVMVVAPAPPKGETIQICAAGYEPAFTETGLPTTGVRLKKGPTGCPLPPGQSPSPSPLTPSLAPSPVPSPSGSRAP